MEEHELTLRGAIDHLVWLLDDGRETTKSALEEVKATLRELVRDVRKDERLKVRRRKATK